MFELSVREMNRVRDVGVVACRAGSPQAHLGRSIRPCGDLAAKCGGHL
jgi:hypothetical protein